MSDLDDDDYNSGEDNDYVPSAGEDGSSDDYDDKDGKNVECTIDEETGANGANRKKTKKYSYSNRIRKGGIQLEDRPEHSEDKIKQEGEIKTLDDSTDKLTGQTKQKQEEKKKERADSLWSNFLKDIGQPVSKSKMDEPSVSTSSVASVSDDLPKKTTNIKEKKNIVTVTKLFDFAGETVEVKEEVDSYLKDDTKLTKTATSCGLGIKRSQGGMGNLLSKISKKSKISTLEKSKLDWNSFKQQEGIEDDLKLHNKGKNGFLEKRDFLDRANQRQYEIEKTFRLGLKKSTR